MRFGNWRLEIWNFFALFVILVNLNTRVRAESPFTDEFTFEAHYNGSFQAYGNNNPVMVDAGGGKFCFAYRSAAASITFGYGKVDKIASRTVSVDSPQALFAVAVDSSNTCLLFYTMRVLSATSAYIVKLSETGATISPSSLGFSFDAAFTMGVIPYPSIPSDFLIGISFSYNGDLKFAALHFATTGSSITVKGQPKIITDKNEVVQLQFYPYTPSNISIVALLKNGTQLQTATINVNNYAIFSSTDSLAISADLTGIASQSILNGNSGVLCYNTNSTASCLQWIPSTSKIDRSTATSVGIDPGSGLTLAALYQNSNGVVLFGQSSGSVLAAQIQDNNVVSSNMFGSTLGLGTGLSFIATATSSNNLLTLLVRNATGSITFLQIRHNYCGDKITNNFEQCDQGPTGGTYCTANCTTVSQPGSQGPPPSNTPADINPNSPTTGGAQPIQNGAPQDNLNGNGPTADSVSASVIVPAIVVPVVVVAAGLIVLLLLLRRRKKRQGSLLHGKSGVEIAMESIDDRLKIPYKSLVFKKEIGAGSYGKVYIGEWKGTPVAIKVSSSVTDVDGFFDEARITVGLQQHPNVVQTFGVSLDGQLPCIVLELCEGGSLDNRLFDSDVTMTQPQKVALIKGIARGLYHLHSNNIVHRDLASRNVLLNKSGTPKISDFGMSRVLKSEAEKGKTKTNYGPIRWMAPESLRDLQYSTKSDVWSFGIVLYEIMSRSEPHIDIDPLEVAVKIKNESYHPPIPQNVDPVLREIMLSCWQPDPNNRPSMEQICNKLNSSFPDDH